MAVALRIAMRRDTHTSIEIHGEILQDLHTPDFGLCHAAVEFLAFRFHKIVKYYPPKYIYIEYCIEVI